MPRKGAGIVRFPRVIFCGFIFTLILVCVVSGPAAARGRAGIFGMRVVNGALAEAMLQQDGLPDNIASVSGTVADGSSKPVPGATVTVKSAAGVKQSARTDSKGKFWIGGLAAGTYTISVRVKGFKNFDGYAVTPGTKVRRIMPMKLPSLEVEEEDDEGDRMNSVQLIKAQSKL